jgi:hypothetical protein
MGMVEGAGRGSWLGPARELPWWRSGWGKGNGVVAVRIVWTERRAGRIWVFESGGREKTKCVTALSESTVEMFL